MVGLTMTRFSEKMLIFNICRRGLMPNLIKKSWTVSSDAVLARKKQQERTGVARVYIS